MNLNKRTNRGFTIIEVLIVLAIASSILLVVFLAVPALQRNSRNTSYRQESQRILTAAQESIANNDNTSITSASSCTGLVTTAGGCLAALTSTSSDANKIMLLANPKNISDLTIEASTGTTVPTLTKAVLRYSAKCSGTTGTTAGTTRQMALLFAVEDNTGAALSQCVNS